MSNSEQSVDAKEKPFRNVIWAILVILGLVWWFYPQIRIAIQPKSMSEVSQETAEETQLPAVGTEAPETVVSDDVKVADKPEVVVVTEAPVASSKTKNATTSQPLDQKQDKLLPKTDIAKPKFDLVRIEEDGSAVIAGLADGMGFVILSVDGEEVPEARTDLNGTGQFVIFAFLPSTQTPQVLRLHLYAEGGGSVIISTETVFVAAAPKIKVQVADVANGADNTADLNDKTAIVSNAQIEEVEVTNQPTVILADQLGVRILQDTGQNEFVSTVSIDTISYNSRGEVSIGGRAAGLGFVRLYLNNKLITTSPISDRGYWTVDLLDVGAGIYTLRVDELNMAGEVVSRAEIPFKREEQKDLVALMDVADDTLKVMKPVNVEVDTPQQTEIIQTTVDVQAEVEELIASENDTGLEVEVSRPISKVIVEKSTKSKLVLAKPSLNFRVKTVQPGSTLWAIAEESYGAGIEYFKVFEANKERIRDPDLIYPGQVFEIPD